MIEYLYNHRQIFRSSLWVDYLELMVSEGLQTES